MSSFKDWYFESPRYARVQLAVDLVGECERLGTPRIQMAVVLSRPPAAWPERKVEAPEQPIG